MVSPFLITILASVGIILAAILVLGFTFTRLYHKSTREMSLIRTGSGGRKVVMDGGILVIPGFHEIKRINMKTTRLEVKRSGDSALITKEGTRVDVGVEFYVTVQGNEEGIARAAQTLGERTGDVAVLREMVEGKLVDALRAVAAQMTLIDLHENRAKFVQDVQTTVTEELSKNGLEMESVSLTALDQTPLDTLDEDNVFNAMGLKNQVERIAESKRKRAEIEAETEVAVAKAKQQAEVQQYEIEQAQEAARVKQAIELETLRTQETTDKARKTQQAERASEEARIERERAVETAEIDRQKAIEIAEQDRQIAIQQKSEEESRARAEADTARAEAVKAEESVVTAREVAEAERKKRITILAAEEEAEEKATSIRVSASAEKEAASDQAEAIRMLAHADADKITIRAEALKKEKLADAEGTRQLIAAENTLDDKIIDFRLAKERLHALPQIVAEMVKPAEKIGGITIHKVDGLGGGANGDAGGASASAGSTGVVNEAFDEMRKMAIQLPVLKEIGKQAGVNMEADMAGLASQVLSEAVSTDVDATPASDVGTLANEGEAAEAPAEVAAKLKAPKGDTPFAGT